MAEKRRIKAVEQDKSKEQEDELPRKFKDVGWKEWFKEDLARVWYGTAVFAFDVLFGLDAMNIVPSTWWAGLFIFLAVVLPPEIVIFRCLWGRNGLLIT